MKYYQRKNKRYELDGASSFQTDELDTHPGMASTNERTYWPIRARKWSVLSTWNCLSRVIHPMIKGGASNGSVGFLHIKPPVMVTQDSYRKH